MWTIRQEQTEAFRQHHLQKFEDEMVEHCKEVSPVLSKLIGDQQVRLAVRSGITQAQAYGFTNRGPIRLFIDLKHLFGSAFDTDPQFPWASKILLASGHEMTRAEELRNETLKYQQKVSGRKAANTYEALRRLSVFAKNVPASLSDDYVQDVLNELERIFPQKVSYTGANGIRTPVKEAISEARRLAFPKPRGDLLLVALMFAFGHGCTNDPLYPWISLTLNDEKITSASARAERLERRALTWLSHVLSLPSEAYRNGA